MLCYKLFRIKEGKLFPLFVNHTVETPVGVWLDAISGSTLPNGKVQSRIGPLAYRPGWHCCQWPVALHIGSKSKGAKTPTHRPDDQVWAVVEVDEITEYVTGNNRIGMWIIARAMKVIKVMTDEQVTSVNSKRGVHDLPRKESK